MQSGRSYWDLTEGQRSDVVCAPDNRILRPPLAAFDVGQGFGRRATGQFQVDGFAGAANGDQIRGNAIELKPPRDFVCSARE